MIRFFFFFFIFLGSSCLFLAKSQNNDSIKTQQIKEVEVLSTSKPSVTASTNPLQVMTQADISKIGIMSVADAVKRFSGLNVKDFGGIGGMKTISIRGIGSEHTGVFYDGIPVSNAQSGQIDIGKFSLDNVAMLSFSIGQTNDIFQTARASASVGSLQIKTKSPSFSNKNYTGQVQMKVGSWGQFNPYLYYAHKLNEKFSLSVDGSWQRSDGYYKFKYKNGNKTVHQKRKNSDVDIWRTELNLYGNLTSTQTLKFKVYYFDSNRGLPGSIVFDSPDNSKQKLWNRDFFTQANYVNQINQKFDFQVQGKYTHLYTRYEDKDPKYKAEDLGIYYRQDKYKDQEVYLSSTLLYKPTNYFSFSLAEDFSYNTLDTEYNIKYTGLIDPKRYSSLTAFTAKYEIKNLLVIGNLLGTYVNEKADGGIEPDDRRRLSPSLSLSYRPFSIESIRIRASYKDIFRIPTFNNLYYTRMGNTSLRPEKTQQYNIGLTWSKSFSNVFSFFSITSDFYHNSVKDKIIAYPAMFESKFVNLGKVNINGLDVSLTADVNVNKDIAIQIASSYTYQYATDITNQTDKNYKDQIPYTPEYSGSASLTIENPWINFSYSLLFSGSMYCLPQNLEANKIDGYSDHSISLNKTFKIKNNNLRVQGDLLNLYNKNYEIIKYYPMPGRSFRLLLNMSF